MPPEQRISLSGPYPLHQLDRLAREVSQLSEITVPTKVHLDLTGLARISPTSMAALITTIVHFERRGLLASGSTYTPPKNRLVARYLDRMGFSRLLTGTDLAEEFTRRPPEGFRPVLGFNDEAGLLTASYSLIGAVDESGELNGRARSALWSAIREIAQNVLDHAESPFGGIAIAQRARKRTELEVAVADSGIGILASLHRRSQFGDITTHANAIRRALDLGVTSNPGTENTGAGLTAVRSFLRTNGGTLLIRSGTGSIEDGDKEATRDDLPHLCGTLVALRLRINQPFDFDLPILGRAPISASAASA